MGIPAQLGNAVANSGAEWDGSNYLVDPKLMRKALIQIGFGMTQSTNDTLTYVGTATTMTLDYFNAILSVLSGNVVAITKYLMAGMEQFQALTQKEDKSR
jgi:hypothetical protein